MGWRWHSLHVCRSWIRRSMVGRCVIREMIVARRSYRLGELRIWERSRDLGTLVPLWLSMGIRRRVHIWCCMNWWIGVPGIIRLLVVEARGRGIWRRPTSISMTSSSSMTLSSSTSSLASTSSTPTLAMLGRRISRLLLGGRRRWWRRGWERKPLGSHGESL